MKILILANHEYTLYGFRREVIDEILKEGHEVHLSFPEGQYADYFRGIGCKVYDIKLSQHGMNPVKDAVLVKRYCGLIRDVNPDVILTYTIKPNIYGGIAGALCGKPYIATITGLGAAFEKGALLSQLVLSMYRVAMCRAQAIFFQNNDHQGFFEKNRIALNRHVLVSGSGVNLKKHCYEAYPEDRSIKILFVGRVTRDKGINELLDAFGTVHKERAGVQLDIVGPVEEDAAAYVRECTEMDGVTYHGRQEDIHEFMKNAHVIVLPSYHEGMANVLLEASACGRPVIATNIPGCKETFEDKLTGLSVPPRSAEALAEAMKTFIDLPYAQKRSMGEAARRKMEREFDRKAVVQRYMDEIVKAEH